MASDPEFRLNGYDIRVDIIDRSSARATSDSMSESDPLFRMHGVALTLCRLRGVDAETRLTGAWQPAFIDIRTHCRCPELRAEFRLCNGAGSGSDGEEGA